jgi:hypothetical protein
VGWAEGGASIISSSTNKVESEGTNSAGVDSLVGAFLSLGTLAKKHIYHEIVSTDRDLVGGSLRVRVVESITGALSAFFDAASNIELYINFLRGFSLEKRSAFIGASSIISLEVVRDVNDEALAGGALAVSGFFFDRFLERWQEPGGLSLMAV